MMRTALLLGSVMMLGNAAALAPMKIWPNGAPGPSAAAGEERDMTTAKDGLVGGRAVIRLGDVKTPTVTVYKPAKAKDTGVSVVVFPGGGYRILAMDLEGTEVCEWLNSIGVTGVLLKYRVPAVPERPRWEGPLQDAQRAVGLVRFHAKEWGLDPARIGVLGFSAGGHLAASASTHFDARTYARVDEADDVSCRPDFAVLVYPAYLTVQSEGDAIAPDLKLSAKVPSSILIQAEDDGVRVENSLFYYAALKKAGVPAEMHLFAVGGHGYGLRKTDKPVTEWPLLVERWMKTIGVLK